MVDLCNELESLKYYEVHLISLYKNDPVTSFMNDIEPQVIYHEIGKKKGFDIKTLFALNALLKKIRPDIVHTHLGVLEYSLLYRSTRKNVRFIHTIHNDAFKECSSAKLRAIRGFFYRNKLITPVTISAESATSFHLCYKQFTDSMIPNGRLAAKTSASYDDIYKKYRGENTSGNEPILINVGRICEQKNQELLINAVETLRKENSFSGRLLIIGGIQDGKIYERLHKQEQGWIEFVGEVQNVADYLSVADAFCLSSKYEGMPISLIEAFSVGCIPVCTPVGGIKEMIRPQQTGFLSTDLSIDAYKNAISEYLNSQNKLEIKSACIREFNEKYHISITVSKYRGLYDK